MTRENLPVGHDLDPGITRYASDLLLNLSQTKHDRRGFLKGSSAFILGLFLLQGSPAKAAGGENLLSAIPDLERFQGGEATPHLFIQIEADETIRIVCHLSEMGQQIWTAVAQVLVDELDAPWENVKIEQAEGHPRYGNQNTDGSRSIRYNFERLRWMGAAMRAMLEEAAAKTWKVPVKDCEAELGFVLHSSGKKLSYGALAERARALEVPAKDKVTLKKREAWRAINKPVKSLTAPSIIRGEGEFGQDVRVEGMKYAVIARPPQLFGKIKTLDDSEALKTTGVERTVKLPSLEPPAAFKPLGGVAVIASDTWAAIKGRRALKIEWEAGPNAGYDSKAFEQKLMEEVRKPGSAKLVRGDVAAALDAASKTIAAEYYVPHQAHSAMEPPAVMARWEGDKVICRGCTQSPQSARGNVARVCNIPEENVTIEVTWLGGGFGRKSKADHFAEAALIAREVKAPVKVVWTREDATQHSYYHSVSAQRLEGGLDKDGKCVALLHRTAFPTIAATFSYGQDEPRWGDLRQGATDTPFAVPNMQVESGKADAHVRIGWMRSVANIYHAFAVQSFAAELAHAAGKDPLAYLLELIGPPRLFDPNKEGAEYDNYGSPMEDYPIDTARLAGVVKEAAKMADWGRKLPEGHGLGVAVHRSFASYVATVVEVAVDESGKLSIPGVWSAIDAGTVVNPNHVKAQVEGGTIFGLSNALFGEITAKDGAIVQRNFPEWRVMRMNEAPRTMEVSIIASTAPPGGVGEPPTPPAAPALTNAIFAATGQRIRRLPVFDASRRDRLPASNESKQSE